MKKSSVNNIESPQISVIMPVYNSENFIEKAIESILSQTFIDFELIIVDDGSIDRSAEIIKGYTDKRILFFEREHLGYVKQLNFAIKKSRGNYIARMDSDDISHPTRFEKQIQFVSNQSNVKLVGSDICIINEDGKEIYVKEYPKTLEEIEFQMPIYSSFCHPSIMIERETLLSFGGYDENLETAEDHILFLKMQEKEYEMSNLPEVLLKYRVHKKSVTGRFKKVQKGISYTYGKMYLDNKLESADSKEDKFREFFRLGLLEYYRGEMSEARKYLINALINKPKKLLSISRYLFISLLGTNAVNYLREKNFLSNINILFVKLFKYDTHKIKS